MQREQVNRTCIGTGFIVLDIIRNAVSGRTTEQRFAGGSCGNVLSILSYFGWSTSAVGRIGDDRAGRELVIDLAKWGVQTRWLKVESGRGTPVIIQENYLDAKGRPRHRFSRACPLCGASLPAYRPLLTGDAQAVSTELPKHTAFFFDRVAPGTVELAKRSRAEGALVVFEPSGIKNERLFRECLKTAHIVKYSRDRLVGVHEIIAPGQVPIEIETLGTSGLRVRISNTRRSAWIDLPAFSAPELRDAAGSGDWCTAGFVQQLLQRAEQIDDLVSAKDAVVSALRFGQALAALNCGFEGARGLMYAADAERVRALAEAIVEGRHPTSGLSVPKKTKTGGRRRARECGVCSNALPPSV